MENLRAYAVVQDLKEITSEFCYLPDNIIDIIREKGFIIFIKTDKSYQQIFEFFMQTVFLKYLELIELENDCEFQKLYKTKNIVVEESPIKVPKIHKEDNKPQEYKEFQNLSAHQSIKSVSVSKSDKLMDLVGEMVIAEAMVTQNPDLKRLQLESFQKLQDSFIKSLMRYRIW